MGSALPVKNYESPADRRLAGGFLADTIYLTFNWNSEATGAFEDEPSKTHGRFECRRIQTMTPQHGRVNFPHLEQVFRIERDREPSKSGKKSTEIVYGVTSVPEDRGTPEKLLAWNRGHWSVEKQPSGARRQLRRGCQPHPHNARPHQQSNLQQHRARAHFKARPQSR